MRYGLALVRVSKIGDRGEDLISPELQRHAIENYAKARGITIIDWIEVLDESGSQKRSKWWAKLDEAICRVEQERLDCLLAWKFSRAARDRLRWAVAVDRIETAGATLESATEGVDTTTATGRFTRGMLAEIAAFEAERIGEGWREVKQRRARLGLADGQPRFGYDIINKTYVPNEWASTVRDLYLRAAAGVSARSLAFWLEKQGAVTRRGNPYAAHNLVKMLDTGFAAGLIRSGGEYLPGAHEPIISAAEWEAYRTTRTPGLSRSSAPKYPLSGLLLCKYCRRVLHAATVSKRPPGTLWVCRGVKDRSCAGVMAWAPKVTRMLDVWVEELLAGKNPEYQAAVARRPDRARVRAQRRLDVIPDELLTIARKNKQGFYDDDTYLTLRAELIDEQRLLRKETEPQPVPDMETLFRANRADALRLVLRHVEVQANARPKYRIVAVWDDD